jgi:hypothetical protein
LSTALAGADQFRRTQLTLKADDVVATGNEWISLPTIRASDGALVNFNALSMRDRGLLQVEGDAGTPALQPYFIADGQTGKLQNLSWALIEYWIPTAHFTSGSLEGELTYCAPPGSRAAFIRLRLTNRGTKPVAATLGMKASWGKLQRVTYLPVEQRGDRTISEAPWVSPGKAFSFVTHDTQFAWSLVYPDSEATFTQPPLTTSPALDAHREVTIAPQQTAEAVFVLAVGVEEFSAAHNARALRELIDRHGSDEVINQAAAWCHQRTRTTGQPDLDVLMNRNLLFTAMYAWGKTIDTEQFVGVTSRSPRYYVSAAYWDRDAMLWSFPGLLDIDPQLAREALEYALTIQLRNTGTHSRFIDGVVLEDGFQLDEGVAPLVALGQYMAKTNDEPFLAKHREAIAKLRDRLLGRFDPAIGLYSSLQDAQDEYQKLPFITYDNVLVWRALLNLSDIFTRLKDPQDAQQMKERADNLKQAILKYCVSSQAPGATGSLFASATDGKQFVFTDIPPGSLLKLPVLGFIAADDPVFVRTYDWLHSPNYKYSYSDQPYGFPGSYRVPFTTSWTVADELQLPRGREKALKILRTSQWDAGIITEGVKPESAVMDFAGRAFATAAGYVGHAICQAFCIPQK